ncbi:MAG: ATP-binding protein [Planctomycetota bacterium]
MAISLASISRGQRIKAPKVVLYGTSGIGKTTFAACAPNPIFLFTEEGQGALDVARIEPRSNDPVLRSWEEVDESIDALLAEEHEYQTLVIDSMDFAERLLWDYVSRKHNKKDIEDFGYGKGYVAALEEGSKLLDKLDRIRNERNMAIILICHEEVVRYDAPDSEGYDRYQLRLQKKLAHKLRDWTDCLLFAKYRTNMVSEDAGFGNTKKRAVGIGERILCTEERPALWAKNRYGLPHELPLTWEAFSNALTASVQPQQPQTQATNEAS